MRLQYQFPKGRGIAGFSLIEVMITVAILSIVLFIGIPGFNTLFDSARERAATSSLASAINLARSEAIKRNGSFEVCVAGACKVAGFDGIRVRNSTDKNDIVRDWEVESNVLYVARQAKDKVDLAVRFSGIGLAVQMDSPEKQMQAPLDVGIYRKDGTGYAQLESYCVSVTGSLMKQECGS